LYFRQNKGLMRMSAYTNNLGPDWRRLRLCLGGKEKAAFAAWDVHCLGLCLFFLPSISIVLNRGNSHAWFGKFCCGYSLGATNPSLESESGSAISSSVDCGRPEELRDDFLA